MDTQWTRQKKTIALFADADADAGADADVDVDVDTIIVPNTSNQIPKSIDVWYYYVVIELFFLMMCYFISYKYGTILSTQLLESRSMQTYLPIKFSVKGWQLTQKGDGILPGVET